LFLKGGDAIFSQQTSSTNFFNGQLQHSYGPKDSNSNQQQAAPFPLGYSGAQDPYMHGTIQDRTY
jgi:hypothetical protein